MFYYIYILARRGARRAHPLDDRGVALGANKKSRWWMMIVVGLMRQAISFGRAVIGHRRRRLGLMRRTSSGSDHSPGSSHPASDYSASHLSHSPEDLAGPSAFNVIFPCSPSSLTSWPSSRSIRRDAAPRRRLSHEVTYTPVHDTRSTAIADAPLSWAAAPQHSGQQTRLAVARRGRLLGSSRA
jgi:hypothetical protein